MGRAAFPLACHNGGGTGKWDQRLSGGKSSQDWATRAHWAVGLPLPSGRPQES